MSLGLSGGASVLSRLGTPPPRGYAIQAVRKPPPATLGEPEIDGL